MVEKKGGSIKEGSVSLNKLPGVLRQYILGNMEIVSVDLMQERNLIMRMMF